MVLWRWRPVFPFHPRYSNSSFSRYGSGTRAVSCKAYTYMCAVCADVNTPRCILQRCKRSVNMQHLENDNVFAE